MLDHASFGEMKRATTVTRESLASITEADEADQERMGLDSPQQAEDQPGRSHQAAATESTSRARKQPRRKWSESEMNHVGAWLDAGYKAKAILDFFGKTFPDTQPITKGMVGYRHGHATLDKKEYEEIMSLGRKLGLRSGRWKSMSNWAWKGVKSRGLEIMTRHQEEWSVENKELQATVADSALYEQST